jgi:hypothetical protein
VNELLKKFDIPKEIQRFSECSPSMFVLLVENILDDHIEGVVRNPKTPSDNIHNMSLVLERMKILFPKDHSLTLLNSKALYIEREQADVMKLIDTLIMLVNHSQSSTQTLAYSEQVVHQKSSTPTPTEDKTNIKSTTRSRPIASEQKSGKASPQRERRSKQEIGLDPHTLEQVLNEASSQLEAYDEEDSDYETESTESSEDFEEDSDSESGGTDEPDSPSSEDESEYESGDEVLKNVLYEAYKRARKKKYTEMTHSLRGNFDYHSAPVSRRTSNSSTSRSSGNKSFKSDINDLVQGMARQVNLKGIKQLPDEIESRRHSAPLTVLKEEDKERERKLKDSLLMPPPQKRIMSYKTKVANSVSSSPSNSIISEESEDDTPHRLNRSMDDDQHHVYKDHGRNYRQQWSENIQSPTLRRISRPSSAPKRRIASKRIAESVQNVQRKMSQSNSPYAAPLIPKKKKKAKKQIYKSEFTDEMVKNSPNLRKYYKLYKQHLADCVQEQSMIRRSASQEGIKDTTQKLDDMKFSKFKQEQERILFARLLDTKIQEENEIKKVYRMVMSLEKERLLSEKNQLKEAEKEFEKKISLRSTQIDQ